MLCFCGGGAETLSSDVINLSGQNKRNETPREEEDVRFDPLTFVWRLWHGSGPSWRSVKPLRERGGGDGEKHWQVSLKLPSVLLMDSSVDMVGLETS